MAFVVVFDACVLHPAPLRDLLIRVSIAGLVRAHWSARILDECFRSIEKSRPDIDTNALKRTRELMSNSMPGASVRNFEAIEKTLELPDVDDRHVLAAAIRCGAQTIVTYNLVDFPESALSPFDIEARHPDEFLLGLIDISPTRVLQALEDQIQSLKRPPCSREHVLRNLRDLGLARTVARINELDGPTGG